MLCSAPVYLLGTISTIPYLNCATPSEAVDMHSEQLNVLRGPTVVIRKQNSSLSVSSHDVWLLNVLPLLLDVSSFVVGAREKIPLGADSV